MCMHAHACFHLLAICINLEWNNVGRGPNYYTNNVWRQPHSMEAVLHIKKRPDRVMTMVGIYAATYLITHACLACL